MRVDFVSLKAFLVVADTEKIREASEQLHLSISAVSRRIAELEEEYDSSYSTDTLAALKLHQRAEFC